MFILIPVLTRVERQADEAGRYRQAPPGYCELPFDADATRFPDCAELNESAPLAVSSSLHTKVNSTNTKTPTQQKQQNLQILLYMPSVRLLFFYIQHIFLYLGYNQLRQMTFFTSSVPGGCYLHKKINDFAKIQVFPVKKCPFCFVERRV